MMRKRGLAAMCCAALFGAAMPSTSAEGDGSAGAGAIGAPADQASLALLLSNRPWDDAKAREARLRRSGGNWGSEAAVRFVRRANTALQRGEHAMALRLLMRVAGWAERLRHPATLSTYRLLRQLGETHASAGELSAAATAYREALMLCPYLPAEYTADAVVRLIDAHSGMGEDEAALMFARVGIAALDGAGYDVAADMEHDLDSALERLKAVAAAEVEDLSIDEEWLSGVPNRAAPQQSIADPTGPGAVIDIMAEPSLVEALADRVWESRRKREIRIRRSGWFDVEDSRYHQRAVEALRRGDHDAALHKLMLAASWVKQLSHRQTLRTQRLLHYLGGRYAAAGELRKAAIAYREALMLGPYLPEKYTASALNQLIGTLFALGEYELSLMLVRVGVAVLDDAGAGPLRAMDRIISEMESLDHMLMDLEHDFEGAMDRLVATVAAAEDRGLVIADQWWAPVYEARHDREKAIALLKDLTARHAHEAR